jgi:tetratricopeptide (TPR) repeat protein
MDDNTLSRLALYATLGSLIAFGCGAPLTQTGDTERNPYAVKAKELVQQRDFRGAAELYRKALRVNPELATAHLELGLLYDDKLGDPIAAIYHYRQFLELRPDSPKRPLVEDFMERAKLNLMASLPQSPVTDPGELVRLKNEKAALLQENAMLQQRLAEWERQAATPTVSAPPPIVAATIPPAPPPSAVSARSHTVQRGDTLQSLALKYYGTRSEWTRIFAANRHQLRSQNELKVGQQLVIP